MGWWVFFWQPPDPFTPQRSLREEIQDTAAVAARGNICVAFHFQRDCSLKLVPGASSMSSLTFLRAHTTAPSVGVQFACGSQYFFNTQYANIPGPVSSLTSIGAAWELHGATQVETFVCNKSTKKCIHVVIQAVVDLHEPEGKEKVGRRHAGKRIKGTTPVRPINDHTPHISRVQVALPGRCRYSSRPETKLCCQVKRFKCTMQCSTV